MSSSCSRAQCVSIHLADKRVLCVSDVNCVVQVGEKEQGATQPEEDPFSDQKEQTSGF